MMIKPYTVLYKKMVKLVKPTLFLPMVAKDFQKLTTLFMKSRNRSPPDPPVETSPKAV